MRRLAEAAATVLVARSIVTEHDRKHGRRIFPRFGKGCLILRRGNWPHPFTRIEFGGASSVAHLASAARDDCRGVDRQPASVRRTDARLSAGIGCNSFRAPSAQIAPGLSGSLVRFSTVEHRLAPAPQGPGLRTLPWIIANAVPCLTIVAVAALPWRLARQMPGNSTMSPRYQRWRGLRCDTLELLPNRGTFAAT
jgi:hypothetical protein